MKSYLTLAWKELKAQRVTSVLILIAVVLSTVMTTAIGQSIGILQSLRIDQAASLNGDRYATFHQLTEDQMQNLSADSRLHDVGSLINAGNMKLGNSGLTLFLREYQGQALRAYPSAGQIKEGRLPEKAGEIALPEDALQYLAEDIRVGDSITLDLGISLLNDSQPPYQYEASFTVSGILESNYIGYSTGTIDAIIGEGTSSTMLPERYFLYSTDFKTNSREQFQSVVYDLTDKLHVREENIQYNWILLDALGIDYAEAKGMSGGEGFSFMTAACLLVGALVLLSAGLVIYNILKISVTKRIGQYGTLRAMGGEKRQLYHLVSMQLILLTGIGIPIGLLFGLMSAKGILKAATGLLNPELFMSDSTAALNSAIAASSADSILSLTGSVAVTLIFAIAAAFPAARFASKVSPTVAMSGQETGIRRLRRKVKRIRSFEAYYARLNLLRSPRRTAITIMSLVMSITVFVALQSFSGLLDASRSVKDMHLGDYAVTNETIGIHPDAVTKMREQEEVKSLSTTKLKLYSQDEKGKLGIETELELQSWETFQIAAIDDSRLIDYGTEQDEEDLKSGRACIVKNPIPFAYEGQTVEYTELKKGDVIKVGGKNLRVADVAGSPVSINNEGFVNGIQLIVTDDLYDELTGENRYSEIYPVLKEGADTEVFEEWLNEWSTANTGSHWLSYSQSDAQLQESFAQINLLCWGLILFIGLIGILNIINTVYTNIHTRVTEIGMQRAIGMSRQSLYKTFLWEGAYYGFASAVIGGVLGYVCTVFVEAAATDVLQLTAVPAVSLVQASAASVAACLIATAIPLRAISRMSIVESIETVD